MTVKIIIKRAIEVILSLLALFLALITATVALFSYASIFDHPTLGNLLWPLGLGTILALLVWLLYIIEKRLWASPLDLPVTQRETVKRMLIGAAIMFGLGLAGLFVFGLVAISGL